MIVKDQVLVGSDPATFTDGAPAEPSLPIREMDMIGNRLVATREDGREFSVAMVEGTDAAARHRRRTGRGKIVKVQGFTSDSAHAPTEVPVTVEMVGDRLVATREDGRQFTATVDEHGQISEGTGALWLTAGGFKALQDAALSDARKSVEDAKRVALKEQIRAEMAAESKTRDELRAEVAAEGHVGKASRTDPTVPTTIKGGR